MYIQANNIIYMATRTKYVVNNSNYTNKDLYEIFQPIGSSKTTTITGYKVNNPYFQNNDLGEIFLNYSTGGEKANPTGYKISNGNDLSDVLAPISNVPTFTFTQLPTGATAPTATKIKTVDNVDYYMVMFEFTGGDGTYVFYPNYNINVYQLFVVAAGQPGRTGRSSGGLGGTGGKVTGYNFDSTNVGISRTVVGGSSSSFNFLAGSFAGTGSFPGNTRTSLSGTTTWDYTTYEAGSAGIGILNYYTGYYYGGAGGNGGGSGGAGYSGGGGGGGASGSSAAGIGNVISTGVYYGGNGGSGLNTGKDGSGNDNTKGVGGTNANGGRGGGGGAGSFGSGGGGGGRSTGGVGSSGGTGGTGGTGVILLICTSA